MNCDVGAESNLFEASIHDLKFFACELGQAAQRVQTFGRVANHRRLDVVQLRICNQPSAADTDRLTQHTERHSMDRIRQTQTTIRTISCARIATEVNVSWSIGPESLFIYLFIHETNS